MPDRDTVTLRQIHRQAADGAQIPVLTSRTDLAAAEVCWRLSARWRQENYFKYAREHFALDALDSYADTADDGDRPVPNPAKHQAKAAVEAARGGVARAENGLSAAIDDAVQRARRPGSGGTATVDPAADQALTLARDQLDQAAADSRAAPATSRYARSAPTPGSSTNTASSSPTPSAWPPTTPNQRSPGCCARTTPEPRTKPAPCSAKPSPSPATCTQTVDTLHVRLDPATAPRRSRALHTLCEQLTATETIYPDTQLKIAYSVKDQPETS